MNSSLKQWLTKRGYKLYAVAKDYYIYENDFDTIIIDDKADFSIIIMTRVKRP